MKIKNIIFDLGGVLLNIDYHATIDAFEKLGIADFRNLFTQTDQSDLFDRMDLGTITPDEFRTELRRASKMNLSDHQIDKAWNAMLLDMPNHKIPTLDKVKDNYRIFLLSNTNSIHYPVYLNYLVEAFGHAGLGHLFEKEYLSFELGLRKPNEDIFHYVLRENNLRADETLFFDDSYQHIEGARKAGLHAYWIDVKKEDVTEFFDGGRLTEDFLIKLRNQSGQSGR